MRAVLTCAVVDVPQVVDGRLQGTDADETLSAGNYNVRDMHGCYGDDHLLGTVQADRLDGGHGQDLLFGGDGDDVLISRSDGREPPVAQEYTDQDDPDGEINTFTRTYYTDQPIESNDVMFGGGGADTFRFELLINAKEDVILRHVRHDGTIHWSGVAGENDRVHDHWVDRLGNEIIMDFDRAEGDRIEIAGHTVDVYKVLHTDTDDDGVLDSTVLYIQSNQGNGGGAHDKDKLGTITVLGELVTASDYTVTRRNFGIVETVDKLDEAIHPRRGTPIGDDLVDGTPTPIPTVDDGDSPTGAVLFVPGEIVLAGGAGDHLEIEHAQALALAQGTIALRFTAADTANRQALFSKDFTGYVDGGHLTSFVHEGRITVRLQSEDRSVWLQTADDSVTAGKQYHLAVTFGPNGFWVYLNGRMEDWDTQFTQGLDTNRENLAIGASTWNRSDDRPYRTTANFQGEIVDFTIFGRQYHRHEIMALAGTEIDPPPTEPYVVDGRLFGTDADETLFGSSYSVAEIHGGYGDDRLVGTDQPDRLDGGHGQDLLLGGTGGDLLVSRSDGREPPVAQDFDAQDDPDGEINAGTRTYYADQPIESNDMMFGGAGADTFRFEVLINAKQDIILQHVNRDRTINWAGVAGENDRVHDHWVERLGNEVIMDFDRAAGDRIEVVGHTVDVYKVLHTDTDADGVLDSTVLYIQSNQGNGGGAHDKDKLGTITVLGELVTASDYTVTRTFDGIVETIDELDEALGPRRGVPIADEVVDGTPTPIPSVDDGALPRGAVLFVPGQLDLAGGAGDHVEVEHAGQLALEQGTISLQFTAREVSERQALFSKDAYGNADGGHLSAFVRDGRVEVRLQSEERSVWLHTARDSVTSGREYHLAVTFGPAGFWVYLNGRVEDGVVEFTQGLETNPENLAIGANTWQRSDSNPFRTSDHLDGQIHDFTVYDSQYDSRQIVMLAPYDLSRMIDDHSVGRLWDETQALDEMAITGGGYLATGVGDLLPPHHEDSERARELPQFGAAADAWRRHNHGREWPFAKDQFREDVLNRFLTSVDRLYAALGK